MQENEKTGRQYPGIDRREFAYCAWRMYMENFKKKCKKTKKQVLNFFILIIILTFSMWIVGGNIYNYFEEKEIKNNIIDLEHELYAIEIIKNFDISNISLTNRKAIIAKSVCATLEPKDSTISPAFVKQNFMQYFVSKGWHINENREKPLEHIQAENQKYIITLERISTANNKWRIIIGNNTFFEKYNL